MCECGCSFGNPMFRFKLPGVDEDSTPGLLWNSYVIEFLPGCSECCVAPGLRILHPDAVRTLFNDLSEINELPLLPSIGDGEYAVTLIKCGLDPSEAESAAVKCFLGLDAEDGVIDNSLAHILGEDFWKDAMSNAPSIVKRKNDDEVGTNK